MVPRRAAQDYGAALFMGFFKNVRMLLCLFFYQDCVSPHSIRGVVLS